MSRKKLPDVSISVRCLPRISYHDAESEVDTDARSASTTATSSLSGYKVKPFDSRFICLCCITAQKSRSLASGGPLLLRTTLSHSESQSCREGSNDRLLLLPDRLAW